MLTTHTIIFLSIIGFIAGYVDGIAGGGGLLTVPALLTVGIPPHLALGTNKLAATMGVFNSAMTYVRKKIFEPRYWTAVIIAAFVGALLGTLATQLVSTAGLQKLLPLLIIAVAIYTLWPKKKNYSVSSETLNTKAPSGIVTSTIIGFYDGFLGPGTGAFWTTAAMAIYKIDLLAASGVARFMNFVSNFAALITFMWLSNVNYQVGFTMGISLMIGAYLGANSAIKFGVNFIRPVFISVVLILSVQLVVTQWL